MKSTAFLPATRWSKATMTSPQETGSACSARLVESLTPTPVPGIVADTSGFRRAKKPCDSCCRKKAQAQRNLSRMSASELTPIRSTCRIGQPACTQPAIAAELLPTVSYTHLRAHETGRNLVCRLLLE